MSDPNTPIEFDPNADPYGPLGFLRNPDGSITRLPRSTSVDGITYISSYSTSPILLAKDIPINQSNNTWIRVFLPRGTLESSSATKLPLIIYFHGGGFILLSAATSVFDNFYSTFGHGIPAIIVSVEYRLGPEHRLPAAYDDGIEVLHWIKNSQDEWLTKYADFSNSFIMGSSAGGNLAYHLGLHAASFADDLKPLNIKGLIFHQPFFGGTKRTESELRCANDKILPPNLTDAIWELALPIGVDRDHEFCNPMLGIKLDEFDGIKALGWKILITGYDGDPLLDRQIELAKILEEKGVAVVVKFEVGGFHGVEFYDLEKLKALCCAVKDFILSSVTV